MSKEKSYVHSKIGKQFHEELEDIKTQRIKRGTSKEKLSSEKLTNLIVRHTGGWKIMKEDLINATEEEIEKLC